MDEGIKGSIGQEVAVVAPVRLGGENRGQRPGRPRVLVSNVEIGAALAAEELAHRGQDLATVALAAAEQAGARQAGGARLAVDENDAPSMKLYDKQGEQRAMLRLNKDDVPSLRMYNARGEVDSRDSQKGH